MNKLRDCTMTLEIGTHCSLLDDLDARQDELLEQIDQLNQRLETLLAQFTTVPCPCVALPAITKSEHPSLSP